MARLGMGNRKTSRGGCADAYRRLHQWGIGDLGIRVSAEGVTPSEGCDGVGLSVVVYDSVRVATV
jgi:hypothetical protein